MTRSELAEDLEAFRADCPGLVAYYYTEEIDGFEELQVQVDNGKPYSGLPPNKGGLRIYYQGPASEFEAWANVFVDGWYAARESTL